MTLSQPWCSGALARFPDLKIVFAEFGFSWVAPLCWRMDTAWERGGISPYQFECGKRAADAAARPYDSYGAEPA